MENKRYFSPGGRYAYTNSRSRSNSQSDNDLALNGLNETIKIPPPNEPPDEHEEKRFKKKPVTAKNPFNQLTGIFKRFKVEELMLLGLIFLLFNENIEDDLLLIVLIYILLTGRE
ncbi:MAG: hypothetical protein Q8920_02700 [Bacillota bacterium]|nr:hypothetical protein [Bacillota bacterium]